MILFFILNVTENIVINMIYISLLLYVFCGIPRVVKSVRNVNLRKNIHRCGNSYCETAISYFKNICSGSKVTVQILVKFPGNEYRNIAVNSQMLEHRLQREDYWIKTLQSVYLYVLNQQTKFMCPNKSIGKLFLSLMMYGERYILTRKHSVENKNNLHPNLDRHFSKHFSTTGKQY